MSWRQHFALNQWGPVIYFSAPGHDNVAIIIIIVAPNNIATAVLWCGTSSWVDWRGSWHFCRTWTLTWDRASCTTHTLAVSKLWWIIRYGINNRVVLFQTAIILILVIWIWINNIIGGESSCAGPSGWDTDHSTELEDNQHKDKSS